MDTTKNTHRIVAIAALAASLAAGLGGCAGTDADASTQRLTIDTSHERERALNRLRAHEPRSAYRDQAERREGFAPPSSEATPYPDQIDRRLTIAG
jgi:hypothetical protein